MTAVGHPRVVETDFHVRYAETDAMGVVHHAAYLVYFEEGRSQYMRDIGIDYADIEASGYQLPVCEISARFVSSASYGQRVRIRTWVVENRSRRVTFNYEVLLHGSDNILVSGFTRHIWVNAQGGVTRSPETWSSLLAP